ncbi:MAG: DUF72 domain-containing protein, partial [Rhodothermales bacterium]|nr:DUF72 domain-containing protein [Rhodothermales bacterium]
MASDALPSPADRRAELARYDFRGVHPRLAFGTASDRYAAWIGQVYPERWRSEVQTRKKRVRGEAFEERQLPIASVVDYFAHFSVLELDFTFYRPLLEADGSPGTNYFVLQNYAEHAPPEARFLVKAPQAFSARTLRRGGKGGPRYEDNPTYLDAGGYVRQFVEPLVELLGERVRGVLFEQAYTRVAESPEPEVFVANLDGFFREVPRAVQTHLEVRSPHLLVPAYVDWLEAEGLGFVFSHWQYLPSIKEQWERVGGRLTAADGNVVLRLLNPRGMSYADAFAAAYPFERPVPELAETKQARQMIDEATALAYRAI